MRTPRPTSSRIKARPPGPGTKYGEMMMTSWVAERISAAMLFAIVSSWSGEASLPIFAGRSASTVAGTHSSCSLPASISADRKSASRSAELSSSGTTGSGWTGVAMDATG